MTAISAHDDGTDRSIGRRIPEMLRPFPYKDLVRMLNGMGYSETSTAGGSRRRFVHAESGHVIRLHESHPGNEIKDYMVRQIRAVLIERGLL